MERGAKPQTYTLKDWQSTGRGAWSMEREWDEDELRNLSHG